MGYVFSEIESAASSGHLLTGDLLINRLETAAGEAGKPDQSSPTISIYWESNIAMEHPMESTIHTRWCPIVR